VTALFEKRDKRSGEARFGLPLLPSRVAELTDTLGMAQALGLEIEDIGCAEYGAAVYSAGVPYHLVPVRDAQALARVTINAAIWNKVFTHEHHSAYVFTLTPNERDNDLAARMFGMGVGEDPGTGSAAASLIGLLSEHANLATGQADYVLRQGHEMGRPCRISIQLRKEQGELVHGGIGGHAVIVGEGVLDLGD